MLEKTKNIYIPFKHFILRTPTYSYEALRNTIYYDQSFKKLLNEHYFQESIYLTSPSLYQSMIKLINKKQTELKDFEKTRFSILKYLIRMSSRCTPFGLFAGFNMGYLGDETQIVLKDHSKKHLRLDMNFLVALALDLSKQENVQKQLKFYPNTSIYDIGDQIRYVEFFYEKSNRLHRISAVEKSEYILTILDAAKDGAKIFELASKLVDDEITIKEAKAFIISLIDAQLLIGDLEPAVTGPEFLEQILAVLLKMEPNRELSETIKILKRIKELIFQLSEQEESYRLEIYNEIEKLLEKTKTKFEKKYLFQLDLVKECKKCTISEKVPQSILNAMPLLTKLSISNGDRPLDKFKEAFVKRYEEEEVPLLTALDTETGIGYLQNMGGDNSALVKGLLLPAVPGKASKLNWHPVYSILLKKLNESIKTQKSIIELLDLDFEEIKTDQPNLPNTISSLVQLFKDQNTEETTIYLKSIGGSSAANLIGRFCHADKETFAHTQNITLKDQELSGAILAEICHLPESRTGNVLLRSSLRKYEIPYLAKANVDKEFQIMPSDLLISIKNNRIVLRSKSLNKIIVPRNTTAHNFANNSLPVYHFLCDLQTQNLQGGLYFNWGPLENEFDYFPRVTYKNLIFSLETWIINKKDLLNILKIKDNEKKLFAFKDFLIGKGIAKKVILSDGDNELFIDIYNMDMLKVLFNLVKNRKMFKLQEFLFSEDNLLVRGPDGGYTNEFIFSFYKS
jgi:hypothetical protein